MGRVDDGCGVVKHFGCLLAGLVLARVCTFGLDADTCSTGFLVTWAVMTACAEAGAFLVASEVRR